MSSRVPLEEMLKRYGFTDTVIVVRPVLVDVTGSMYAACLLSQLLYWSRRSSNPEGWVYKTEKDMYRELRLNGYQLRKARQQLCRRGIIETILKLANGHPVTHYRVNLDALEAALQASARQAVDGAASNVPPLLNGMCEGDQLDCATIQNPILARSTNGFCEGEQVDSATVDESVTETTTETTTQITTDISCSSNARERRQRTETRREDSAEPRTASHGARGRSDYVPVDHAAPVRAGSRDTPDADILFAILERAGGFPRTRDYGRLYELLADYPGIAYYLEFKKFAEYWSGRKLKRPWLALRNWLERTGKHERATATPASPAGRGRSAHRFRRELPRVYTPPPVYDD